MTKDVRFKKSIASGESETVEFKNSFDREIIETLAAFANTKGGKVFVGISDKGKITGAQLNKESVQTWINQAKQPWMTPLPYCRNLSSCGRGK